MTNQLRQGLFGIGAVLGALLAAACSGAATADDVARQEQNLQNGGDTSKDKDPGTDPTAGVGGCFGVSAGHPTSCKTLDQWKVLGSSECSSKGGYLNNIAFTDECGKDGFRVVKFECCGDFDAKDPAGKDPAGSPPPSSCITVHDAKLCHAPDAWKVAAEDHCAKQGLSVGDLEFVDACGAKGKTTAKFTCCK